MNSRYIEANTPVVFTAERAAQLHGRRYRAGDSVVLRAVQDVDLDDLAGNGGPWGWGGFTALDLKYFFEFKHEDQ